MTVTSADYVAIISKITNESTAEDRLIYLGYFTGNFRNEIGHREKIEVLILKSLLPSDREFFYYLSNLIARNGNTDNIVQEIDRVYIAASLVQNNQHRDRGSGLCITPKAGLPCFSIVGLVKTFNMLDAETAGRVLVTCELVFAKSETISSMAQNFITGVQKIGPQAGFALALGYLGYEGEKAIYRWSKGEISGKRCAMQILESAAAIAASFGAGRGAAALAKACNSHPVTIVVIGILAGLAAGALAAKAAELALLWGLDLPKDETEEKAYNFLGVSRNSPASEINAAFYRLCHVCHPDRGGSQERYLQLQVYMNVIRAARGELPS